MENVTSSAGAKCGTEGMTDVMSTAQLMAACDVPVVPPGGTFSMALSGSSLLRLLRLQDQRLRMQSTYRSTRPEATLQLPARADGDSPPGPSAQPVHLNTITSPREWTLGESSQGSNGSPQCVAILAEIKSTERSRLTALMPRYLSQSFLHRADHIESALDATSRRIANLSKRVVYLMERSPDECSPRDLKVETSELESMWAQVWGILQRTITIEDLMLRTPDIQKTEIDRLSSLISRVSSYTSGGAAELCELGIRIGLGNVSATLDQLLLSFGNECRLTEVNRFNDKDRTGLLGSMICGCRVAGGGNRNDAVVMGKVADNVSMELGAGDSITGSDEGTKPVAEDVWQYGHKVWNRG